MKKYLGRASVRFEEAVYILSSASVVGTKEGEGPLGELFDIVGADDMFGGKSWEEAESSLQKDAVYLALKKAAVKESDISFLFAGDLLGQSIATSFGISNFQIPLLGVYGACSTCGESMLLGAMSIDGGFAEKVVCVTSSHFASAEKEFRFPLEYGSQRPLSASWTVTGSGAFVLTACDGEGGHRLVQPHRNDETGCEISDGCPEHSRPRAKITGITVGKIVDYGLKDNMNMGACMAPAAADTLCQHFDDFHSQPSDYDKIITGDLGGVGQTVLFSLLREQGIDIEQQHLDCGLLIYDDDTQDTHAGGSGSGCCATVLSAYILKKLEEGEWNKVLFCPTGALLSKTSFNEGKSVPGICHCLVIEKI